MTTDEPRDLPPPPEGGSRMVIGCGCLLDRPRFLGAGGALFVRPCGAHHAEGDIARATGAIAFDAWFGRYVERFGMSRTTLAAELHLNTRHRN